MSDTKPASKKEYPKWFKPKSWLEADVDLSAFGIGVVHLRDATFERQSDWWAASQANEGVTVDARAKMFGAYIDRCDGGGMPPPRANWEQWVPWVREQRSKVVARLAQAIFLFQEYLEVEGEVAPNSSTAN